MEQGLTWEIDGNNILGGKARKDGMSVLKATEWEGTSQG